MLLTTNSRTQNIVWRVNHERVAEVVKKKNERRFFPALVPPRVSPVRFPWWILYKYRPDSEFKFLIFRQMYLNKFPDPMVPNRDKVFYRDYITRAFVHGYILTFCVSIRRMVSESSSGMKVTYFSIWLGVNWKKHFYFAVNVYLILLLRRAFNSHLFTRKRFPRILWYSCI